MTPNRILLTCPRGLAPYLKDEVLDLGYPVKADSETSVRTEGGERDAMRLCLWLRTAHRVLWHLGDFRAESAGDLYREAGKVPWERWLDPEGYVSVTSTVDTESVNDRRYANVKCKDAIVDRMTDAFGRRPDSGPLRDKAVVHLHWMGGWASLYLDMAGEPLSFRGYRTAGVEAPMRESLAAAVVMAAGWRGEGNFVNPMCGGGTLAIEAALIALNRAPGLARRNYGFMHLRGHDEAAWRGLVDEALAEGRPAFPGRIVATDMDAGAVDASRDNARRAGVAGAVEFGVCDFRDTDVPLGGGAAVLNPPYGGRVGEEEALAELYREIGDFFKKKCAGYKGYVFTGNPRLGKAVGLRTKRKLPFWNGPIECRLLEYELYGGRGC